jgi:hypothetical protein
VNRSDRPLYLIALAFGVLPLWVSRHLPLVDLPQHLHLISVLHRIDDPRTLYSRLFAIRTELTPYLGYYYTVSFLNWFLPLGLANKVFLSAYVIGMPLGLAFLLRSVGRPTWPSLLSLPFAYGDSFAWGFVNYCSALPLAFLACGLLVRSISDRDRRKAWAIGLAVSLVLTLLFHVQVFAFLGLALPLLLLTTRAPEGRDGVPSLNQRVRGFLATRAPALAAIAPAGALFGIWVVGRIGMPAEVEYGSPWKAWGPVLSPSNLFFKSFAQNRDELLAVLANQLRDGSDRYALYAVAAVAAAAVVLGCLSATRRTGSVEGPVERWRILALGLIALCLYFTLPFDIRGYMYYLNTRYAHLAAALLVCAVPPVRPSPGRFLAAASAGCATLLGIALAQGFVAFGRESSALDRLVPLCPPAPLIMGLIFDPSSRVVTHPVYLHSAATLALERGGATNFSFARTPHSPIRYRRSPPPTFPSEWRPDQFDYAAYGRAYDAFLIRGAGPAQIFGPLLGSELELAGRADGFYLVRRR